MVPEGMQAQSIFTAANLAVPFNVGLGGSETMGQKAASERNQQQQVQSVGGHQQAVVSGGEYRCDQSTVVFTSISLVCALMVAAAAVISSYRRRKRLLSHLHLQMPAPPVQIIGLHEMALPVTPSAACSNI